MLIAINTADQQHTATTEVSKMHPNMAFKVSSKRRCRLPGGCHRDFHTLKPYAGSSLKHAHSAMHATLKHALSAIFPTTP